MRPAHRDFFAKNDTRPGGLTGSHQDGCKKTTSVLMGRVSWNGLTEGRSCDIALQVQCPNDFTTEPHLVLRAATPLDVFIKS